MYKYNYTLIKIKNVVLIPYESIKYLHQFIIFCIQRLLIYESINTTFNFDLFFSTYLMSNYINTYIYNYMSL